MEHLCQELKVETEDCESDLRSDLSESESWNSYCSGSDSENIPWLQYVGSDGKLFYIERDADVESNFEDSLKHADPQESWSYVAQERSKLNAAEKIKQWMRNRGKKVRKSFPLLKSSRNETNVNSSEFDSLSHDQSKDIFIDIDSAKTIPGYRSLSEKLFGLKLGSQDDNFGLCDKVTVIGVLRGQSIPDIKIGDWLKSINGIDVNMGSVENVLKELSMQSKVKLNIISSSESKNIKPLPLQHRHNNLIKELLGDSSALECAKLQFQHIPHGIFYISTEDGTFENDDVLYRYPNQGTPLFQLHGMFLTIGLMIDDVATAPLLSCSVMVEKQIVHVGFVKEGNSVMAVAVPASVASSIEVQHFTAGLAKCLKFQFCTLRQAFLATDGGIYLENFFTLYFSHYLSSLHYDQNVFSEPHLQDILPTAHWLPLPNDLKTEIDDILTELESADFGNDSDGFYRDRRIYNIFGSCLFYKGYLISSTLPKDDLLDIHLFLHYSHILELTQMQSISRIIIWKEVFPSRHQEHSSVSEYEEVHGRWFIIVVVMQHCILAVLLDDDGCALKVEGHPPPEPFYVEEVQNTLFILQDCGLIAAIEKLLHFCVDPVASSDLFFKNTSSRNSSSSMFASNVSIHSSGPHLSSVHSTSHSSLGALKEVSKFPTDKVDEIRRQQRLSAMGPADGESGSETSYSNGSNENATYPERFRSCSESTGSSSKLHESSECSEVYKDSENQLSRNFSSLPDLNGTPFTSDGICFENSIRMVSGFGSNLFYYLHMDPVEGIFIAPVMPDLTMPGTIHSNILNSFHRSCMSMRTIFERSLRNAQMTKVNIKTKYGVNSFLQNAYEQGILFHCKKMDSAKQKCTSLSGSFWVVGRLFFLPEPREVYVCYHGSTAQDVVEMAFRLGFGLSF